MKRVVIIFVLLLAGLSFGQTIYGNSALPPGAFLWLSGDARTEAMATTATADGGIASGWANPAALFENRDVSAGATYSYVRSKTNNSGLFATKRFGSWAGAMRFFLVNSNEIEARTGPTSQPDYLFDTHQLYTQFTIAKSFSDFVSFGGSAKWIHERIDQFDREGWVFDIGLAGEYEFIKGGVAVNNFGGKQVYFDQYRENYPTTYRVGLAGKILDYGLVAVDYVKPDLLSGYTAIGIEGYLHDMITLRAGYTPGHDTRNISAGIGVKYAGLNLDYALTNFSQNLGISHQVTLSFRN
jgi:hypothetical protein